ncbi:tetratricopeptide repeat protein [Streptomyces sp. MAI_2237]
MARIRRLAERLDDAGEGRLPLPAGPRPRQTGGRPPRHRLISRRTRRAPPGPDPLPQGVAPVQATGDLSGQAHTCDSLGRIHRHLGRHADAVECHDRALALFRRTGDRRSEAIGLTYLGDTHETAGAPGIGRRRSPERRHPFV